MTDQLDGSTSTAVAVLTSTQSILFGPSRGRQVTTFDPLSAWPLYIHLPQEIPSKITICPLG